jgi:M6 family metalloprotease-like protein
MKKLFLFLIGVFSLLIFVSCKGYSPSCTIDLTNSGSILSYKVTIDDPEKRITSYRVDLYRADDNTAIAKKQDESVGSFECNLEFDTRYVVYVKASYGINIYKTIGSKEIVIKETYDFFKFENTTLEYNGQNQTIEVQNLGDYTVEYNRNDCKDVGVYDLVAYIKNGNTIIRTMSATLTIVKGNLPILDEQTYEYTGEIIDLYQYQGLRYTYYKKDGDNMINVSCIKDPGIYEVQADFNGDDNYNALNKKIKVTVSKLSQKLSLESQIIYLKNNEANIEVDESLLHGANYKVTYYDNYGHVISKITKEGYYSAKIEVDETSTYNAFTKVIGLTCVNNNTELNTGISMDKVEYFTVVSRPTFIFQQETAYEYLFFTILNSTNKAVLLSDLNIMLDGKNLSQTIDSFKSISVQSYSSYTILITSKRANTILYNGLYDISFSTSKVFSNQISINYNSIKYEVKKSDTTYDDFVANYTKDGYEFREINSVQDAKENLQDKPTSIGVSPSVTISNKTQTISKTRINDLYNIEISNDISITSQMIDTTELDNKNIGKEITIYYDIYDENNLHTKFNLKYVLVDEEAPVVEETEKANHYYDLHQQEPNYKEFFKIFDDDTEIEVTDQMIDKSEVNLDVEGIYYIYVNVEDKYGNNSHYPFKIVVGSNTNVLSTYGVSENLIKSGPNRSLMPSTGNVKVLVVPVSLDSSNESSELLNKINVAFNGVSSATSYESVKSYYAKSSYNNLNLAFDVYDKFVRLSYNANTYAQNQSQLFKEALNSIKNEGGRDLSQYDSNSDGIIDAIWFIYNIPNYSNSKNTTSDFYWAWTSDFYDYGMTYDGKKLGMIAFASYDFMDSKDESGICARTFIHESGHLMGLDDYYDYDYDYDTVGTSHTMFGIDMMDQNYGDHNAASKLLLGWIDPEVITKDTKIDMSSTTETGDVILIAKDFEKSKTIFRELFLVEFYTSTGLNKFNEAQEFGVGAYGLRILHLDATINIGSNGEPKLTGTNYQSYFKYNNTDNDTLNFLETLPSNESLNYNRLKRKYTTTNGNILFASTKDIFGETCYKDYKLHDGSDLFFTIKISQMTAKSATLEITFK